MDSELQSAPRNQSTKRIFIAATGMNDGKTTTSLALFAALREKIKAKKAEGKKVEAARILGINRKTLSAKINKYGLK